MKNKNVQNTLSAGSVLKEVEQIKRLQKNVDSYLTAVTNTCSGFLTIICC